MLENGKKEGKEYTTASRRGAVCTNYIDVTTGGHLFLYNSPNELGTEAVKEQAKGRKGKKKRFDEDEL